MMYMRHFSKSTKMETKKFLRGELTTLLKEETGSEAPAEGDVDEALADMQLDDTGEPSLEANLLNGTMIARYPY